MSPETSLAFSRALSIVLTPKTKAQADNAPESAYFAFLCTHHLLNKSTKMPVLYINTMSQFIHSKFQKSRHITENPAKNYRRKEQTTVSLLERSIVHSTAASQASRLMYNSIRNASFLPSPTSPHLHAGLLITARWQDKIKGRKQRVGKKRGLQLQKEVLVLHRVTFYISSLGTFKINGYVQEERIC